jgi:tetrahydrodipicolinate N-succinyltransferase
MSAAEKIWKLAAPDWSSLDTIWRNPLPFVLWPVGNQPLLAHWMDEAVRQGIAHVEIFVADRPAEVRQWLEDGVYWSRKVKVTPVANEEGMPPAQNCQRLDRLPSERDVVTPPADAAALLKHWFSMQTHWLKHRLDELPSLDARHVSGGWTGPGAVVASSARLIAPFWIGADARIGPGCRIGPNAFIGRHAIVDANVEVEEAYIAEGTYVGKFTRVSQAIASGKVLVDIRRGVRLELQEHFILSTVRAHGSRPGFVGRLGALLCSVLLAPLALLRNAGPGDWSEQRVTACAGDTIELRTGRRGPLWMRRWPWFRHIAAGRLRWIGALPRGESDFERMPKELAAQVRSARAGMFSLADLNHCSGVADADEWLHATYQVQGVDPGIPRRMRRNLWKIAWSRPVGADGGTPP